MLFLQKEKAWKLFKTENPENLRRLFEDKLKTRVELKKSFYELRSIKFIRSAELVYLAYKKGLIKLGDGDLLDALLYAVKYKGCAISRQEIEEAKKLKFWKSKDI